ncbi:peptide chain release factor N(5)-glutamine methyltransferase [Rubricoccus marinus]|uniref:Release factor glutamine methyltransferase n=1 Tax=Rubricoccus marinus TaxID=716817 RepID=A0A259TZ64_9BACT|nr:peptide chain release factor N(5)-glutamine methyltransferase [Rubricoccus marinus]OZC02868.1 protein-(glutamine-N5) methyltransferase, release factor-specific [Rubricoccus marinus]
MTRLEFLTAATERLHASGVEDARRNAEWIVEDVTGASRAGLYASPNAQVGDEERERMEGMVLRRASGEPIQYVLGHADFMTLRLRVAPGVLIPRPETEEVLEAALSAIRECADPWVLDIGTGSGALALGVASERSDATVFAADVSPEALEIASANADELGLDVSFVHADALRPQFADRVPPAFDLILSNPPYVPLAERPSLQREVREHEPGLALFVPDHDPLVFYRAVAGHASGLLRPGGWLVVETHADHGRAVVELFQASGLTETALQQDLSGRDRIARGRMPLASGARG